jgi:hypothetical protein
MGWTEINFLADLSYRADDACSHQESAPKKRTNQTKPYQLSHDISQRIQQLITKTVVVKGDRL